MPSPRGGIAVQSLYRQNRRGRGPNEAIGRPGLVFGRTEMGGDLSRRQRTGVSDNETLERALNDPTSRRRLRSIPFEIRDIERRAGKNKKGMSARQRDRIGRLQRELRDIEQGRDRIQKELDRRKRGGKKAAKNAATTVGGAKKTGTTTGGRAARVAKNAT